MVLGGKGVWEVGKVGGEKEMYEERRISNGSEEKWRKVRRETTSVGVITEGEKEKGGKRPRTSEGKTGKLENAGRERKNVHQG